FSTTFFILFSHASPTSQSSTLSLHDALPISTASRPPHGPRASPPMSSSTGCWRPMAVPRPNRRPEACAPTTKESPMHQSPQPWVPAGSRARITEIAEGHLGAGTTKAETVGGIESLIAASDRLHDEEAFNLNPASNVLNPRAAALLASGAGPRTSLGYAGAKYEMGLEHIEQVEVVTAELAARVFNASFAEVRVPSGAM